MPKSNAGKRQGVGIVARPIIERAEVYPKRPKRNDICFDILWSEISKMPNGQPKKIFTVYFDELHELAKEGFTINNINSLDVVNNVTAE